MKKRTVIQFTVTPKEKRSIQRAAKRDGLTVSAWLKFRAFAPAYTSKPENPNATRVGSTFSVRPPKNFLPPPNASV